MERAVEKLVWIVIASAFLSHKTFQLQLFYLLQLIVLFNMTRLCSGARFAFTEAHNYIHTPVLSSFNLVFDCQFQIFSLFVG